jgi:hypothetical protein
LRPDNLPVDFIRLTKDDKAFFTITSDWRTIRFTR